MCSLYWLPVAKNRNSWKILTFGDSCTDRLLPARVKFGGLEQTQGLHLHAKFHPNLFIVSSGVASLFTARGVFHLAASKVLNRDGKLSVPSEGRLLNLVMWGIPSRAVLEENIGEGDSASRQRAMPPPNRS